MGRRNRGSSASETVPTPKRTRHRYNLRATSSRAKRDKLLGGDQNGRRVVITDEEFREKNAALDNVSEGKALNVEKVELLQEKNRAAHYTSEYEQEDLIVRRGWPFSLQLHFDRKVRKDEDIIILKFAYGARPQESKGTVLRLPLDLLDFEEFSEGWLAKVTELHDKTVTVEITSEADSMVGKYELLYETKLKDSETDFVKQDLDTYMYMLFNPWCKDDVVYMENEGERFEYVLNDVGRIWIGSARSNHGRPWNFGQFEKPVLDVTLGLLDKGELADTGRTSVVSIIRCLSALTNSMDDEGLLEGRWTSEYPKTSTKPWEWTGSVAIIEKYQETGKPVQYGQCWVFSGVITTLLRCLGIPTRSVTNFESAHDVDCSMTIDAHFNEDGEPLEHLDDSTWNFHVWNESYFERRDLPDGYGGWQAHDATPQEASEGVMRCGPAPLKAIKEGHVYLSYDVGFIFAEVNGDKVEWEVREDGSMRVCHIDRRAVGQCISTKAVGSDLRHDLTLDYKYKDGSIEEKKVLEFVNRFSTERKKNIYKRSTEKELEFDVVLPETCVGQDINLGVKVKNTGSEKRSIKVNLTVATTFYTGVVGKKVKGEIFEETLESGEEREILMPVTAEEYEIIMNPEANFKLTATCKVVESGDMIAKCEPFFLKKPTLRFELPEKIPLDTETNATVIFKNTTNLKLHNSVFHVAGSYLVKARSYTYRKVVHPDEEVTIDVAMIPCRLNERTIMATFSSDELTDVKGEATVFVVSKSEWKEEEKNEVVEEKSEEVEEKSEEVEEKEEEAEEKEEEAEEEKLEAMETETTETKPEEEPADEIDSAEGGAGGDTADAVNTEVEAPQGEHGDTGGQDKPVVAEVDNSETTETMANGN